MGQRIRLTESQLRNIIRRCVKEAVNEEYGEYVPTKEDIAYDITLCVENNLGGERYGVIIDLLAKKVRKGIADVETLANSQFLHRLCMDKVVDVNGKYRNSPRDVREYVRHDVAEALIRHAEDLVSWEAENKG